MEMHPAVYLIQMGVNSLGFDPGVADSWWGRRTHGACQALYRQGPQKSSAWAVMTLQRGLAGLGYYEGSIDGGYGPLTRKALGRAIDADGMPAAAWSASKDILKPSKKYLRKVTHDRVLRQGSAGYVIDTIFLHCLAVPGDWAIGKSNMDIRRAVHRMHTLPESRGGRGWRDIGYGHIICPDGEVLPGRPIDQIGAGALGYNRGVIHIAMVEVRTITVERQPEDYFRPETLFSAKSLIDDYGNQTPIRRLSGHNEVAAKLCPGFKVIDREWTELAVV